MKQDPYRYFRVEARELVQQLDKGLLELEKLGGNKDVVARILRATHTLKGAARIVKLSAIADLAHALEDALEPHRNGEPIATLDPLLSLADAIATKVRALDHAPAAVPASPRHEPPPAALHASSGELDGVLGGLTEIQAQVHRLRELADAATHAVRVDQLERDLREVRVDIERLRLQGAGDMFGSLERAVRDAVSPGVQATFVGIGGDVRLDGRVLGALQRALVQLVRNAVAHGVERVDERVRSGKPAAGTIEVALRVAGNRVICTCRDDGRGIDLAAVRRAADRTGGTQEELVEMLFRGGVSTATSVTELAGRGIGLELVRSIARELDGDVTATTEPGRGTTITLSVALSLTAVQALIVTAGDHVAAIPMAAVRRVITIRPGELASLDDLVLVHASLADLLGGTPSPEAAHPALIVASADRLVAVGIDRMLGVEEIVVRPLTADIPADPIVWGLMLDAHGLPRPVLDAHHLVEAASRVRPPRAVTRPARIAPILIVDDSLTTRMLEQAILESAGYDVELAASAEEGLEKVAARSYALCLVDVEMPGMDGFSFIAELRRRPALATLPAIMVSSRSSAEDRRRGAAAGAQGYVVKGEFDQIALLALIRKLTIG